MRGHDAQQAGMCRDRSPEERVPATHPLRPIRHAVDTAWVALSSQRETRYARTGRPSMAPEQLRRALVLQGRDSLRSERLLMEERQYHLLFRWCVGHDRDAPVWDVTVFTKKRLTAWCPTSISRSTVHGSKPGLGRKASSRRGR